MLNKIKYDQINRIKLEFSLFELVRIKFLGIVRDSS